MSHNTFGHLFRVTTWGESHGPALGCVIDGCPPGIRFTLADIQGDLDRRRPGQSRFVTQRREPDEVRVLSGFLMAEDGVTMVTTGTPVAMTIDNVDQRSKDYGDIARQYRPGHADYTYEAKYGLRDHRGGGRASARETAARVAAGALARRIVPGMKVRGALLSIGEKSIDRANWNWNFVHAPDNPFFTPDPQSVPVFTNYLDAVRKAGSSVGALVEIVAEGVPAGLGAPVYAKLDQDIAAALMSINAVKGVEIGNGFAAARATGEANADEMRIGNDGRRSSCPTSRRHTGRHLDRPGDRGALRGEADLVDPDPAPLDRPRRQRRRDQDEGPPRPLRGHSRRAGRRGHACLRARRPLPAQSRPDRPRLTA